MKNVQNLIISANTHYYQLNQNIVFGLDHILNVNLIKTINFFK